MKLYTLGTSHGATEVGRSCSGNLLEVNGKYYLFDCGGNVEEKMTDLGLSFDDIGAVFISHMHADHVGTLSSVVKRFYGYNETDNGVKIYMPEQNAIDAFKIWLSAMHFDPMSDKVSYALINKGEIYADENITVSAINTKHMEGGKYPSYAFVVKSADKNFVYTGDLYMTLEDYPEVIFEVDFDAVLCELVHFKVEDNLEKIIKSRTKKLIFTHLGQRKILEIEDVLDEFPFDTFIANNGDCYEI